MSHGRILFISNLYPNLLSPSKATFNRQQIASLNEHCDIEVISPIPWTSLLKHKLCQPTRVENGIVIHHPIFYFVPRILRNMYGEFYYLSIKSVADRLLKNKHFDLIFSSWLYPDSWAAAKLARRHNLPLFVKVHGTDVNRLIPGTAVTKKSLVVAKQAKKVICVSRALQERLIEMGVSASSTEVHYNGVDRSVFFHKGTEDARQQLGVDPSDFLVLYVGNLIKEKGLEELILAFKSLENKESRPQKLVIIGSGAYDATAKKMVSMLNITEKVLFLGTQSLSTIATWMNAASVLCLPSYMEGVPNVVLEALSCGTKVIATNVGGIPELNHGKGNMILIQPKSVESLSKALAEMMQNNLPHITSDFICTWQENTERLFNVFMGDEHVNR